MKIKFILVLVGVAQAVLSFAQSDSIVTFSNLKFQSVHEKRAFDHFAHHQADTLNAFLALDDLLGSDDFVYLQNKLEEIWKELSDKKISSKKMNAQIKMVYATVKDRCMNTYAQGEFLSSTLTNGRYNEVSASVILALMFDRLHIPYQLLDSPEQFAFIANPGANEQKLEVGNPIIVHVEKTPEDKKEYVDYLRKCGVVSDLEMRTYSYAEVYDLKTMVQKPITLLELLGIGYYWQSNKEASQGNLNGGLERAQKASYLNSAPYIQYHLFHCLVAALDQFTIRQASDIDFAVQLHRVGYLDVETTANMFNSIISKQLEFEDKAALCDSMYERFTSRVQDQALLDELTFSYNLMRVNQKNPNFADICRVDRSACIKPNIKEVNNFLEGVIQMNLYRITSMKARLDSVRSLSKQVKSPTATMMLESMRQTFLLNLAVDLYKEKNFKEGEKYLLEFESSCPVPIQNEALRTEVESAYRTLAVSAYWGLKQDLAANRKMIQRGLKLVPGSEIIQSGQYEKSTVKYVNTNPEVKYLRKEEQDKTPKTGRSIRVISKDKKEKVYSF